MTISCYMCEKSIYKRKYYLSNGVLREILSGIGVFRMTPQEVVCEPCRNLLLSFQSRGLTSADFPDRCVRCNNVVLSGQSRRVIDGQLYGKCCANLTEQQYVSVSSNTTLSGPSTLPAPVNTVAASEGYCFICRDRSQRSRIHNLVVANTWMSYRIFVPFTNRCCPAHIVTEQYQFNDYSMGIIHSLVVVQSCSASEILRFTNEMFTALNNYQKELQLQMQRQQDQIIQQQDTITQYQNAPPRLDFDSPNTPESAYTSLFGLSLAVFNEIFHTISADLRTSCNRTPRNALAIFLAFLRAGTSQDHLSALFGLPRQRVSSTIDDVSKILDRSFVPLHLGYSQKSSAWHTKAFIKDHHTTDMARILTRSTPEKLLVVLDGTYFYVQQSANFDVAKATYSMHKFRNLVKAMIVCSTDGYIIEVEGLYFADGKNNDASILNSMYNSTGFSEFLDDDALLIVDRGFRDSVTVVESYGHEVAMPQLLTGNRKQFSDMEANTTRLVTKIRWVVESVNGRLKNVFHFFNNVVQNHYLQSNKLLRFLRIACAILNAHFPVIRGNQSGDIDLANFMVQRSELVNLLRERIESEGWKSVKHWTPLREVNIQDFPILSTQDLKDITVGIYQIKLAPSYMSRQLALDSSESVENSDPDIYVNKDVPDLLRFKIRSRFVGAQHHYTYVHYHPNMAGPHSIRGWYCTCKSGARVVGCCAHVAAMLWYLGFARFQRSFHYPAMNVGLHILNAS